MEHRFTVLEYLLRRADLPTEEFAQAVGVRLDALQTYLSRPGLALAHSVSERWAKWLTDRGAILQNADGKPEFPAGAMLHPLRQNYEPPSDMFNPRKFKMLTVEVGGIAKRRRVPVGWDEGRLTQEILEEQRARSAQKHRQGAAGSNGGKPEPGGNGIAREHPVMGALFADTIH